MKPVDEELELARLLASEPSPLGSSLSALRARGPDASELGLLASRLSLGGIAVTSPSRAAAAAPKTLNKWLIPGAGGAALGALLLALRGPAPAPTAPGNAEARARALETQRSQGAAPLPPQARGNRSASAAPSDAALEPPTTAPVAPDAALPAEPAGNEAALPVSEHGPATARPGATASATDAASPSSLRGSAAPTSLPASGSNPTPATSSVADAPSEIELLRDARLALRQSPGAALAFAEQHARLYPQGKLTQERELIAISALVATGHRTAALSRGARFEQAFPTSPYRKQLGDLLK